MYQAPWKEIGRIQQDVDSLKSQKAESHEVHTLTRNVDSLEHSLREIRAEVDGLRRRCEELEASRVIDGRDIVEV